MLNNDFIYELIITSTVFGVEDEPLPKGLEEGEVGIGLEGLLVDVVALHIVLIEVHETIDAVADDTDAKVGMLLDGDDLTLQVHLLQRELTDLVTVV